MTDPTWSLQRALYTALSDALAIPVYDMGSVPSSAAMPYVAIGPFQATSDDILASKRDMTSVYLTAWTDYGGQKAAHEINAAIYGALHRQRLPMADGRLVIVDVVRRSTEPDLRVGIFKGTAMLRCRIEH